MSALRFRVGFLLRCGGAASRPGIRVAEVTGITVSERGDTDKEANFTWTYDVSRWPADLQAVFKNHPRMDGQAQFRLYDDGWRLENAWDALYGGSLCHE